MVSPSLKFAAGRWRAHLALGFGAGLLAGRLAAASLVATLDESTTQPGEPVTLSLTFEGAKPAEPPMLPPIPNLTIAYLGQSSQIQIINGRTTSRLSFNYAVTASQPGEYTIPAVRVQVGGETLTSQPLKLVVGGAEGRQGQVALLKLSVPKAEAYVGEAMVIEIRLLVQRGVGGQVVQPPQFKGEGVTVGQLTSTGTTAAQADGIAYQVLTYQVPVTFVKAGEFTLAAGDCVVDLQLPSRARRRSLFDSPFFSSIDTRRLTLTSEPVTIQIRSLPTDRVPPGFTGAVGDFTLSASVSTNVVTAGDPITLTVRLAGRGPIETLRWEASSAWAGFKTYPPSTQVTNSDALGLSGMKTFEQAVIPESPQVKQIPPIMFSFFDPEQRQYRTVSHPATPITVKAATVTVAQPVVVAATERGEAPPPPPATDIVHIKSRPGTFAQIAPPWVERPGFLLLQCVPLAGWLAALAWRRAKDRLANDPRLRRRQQVVRVVRDGLVELRQAAAANHGEAFFATTFRLVQEQLGERLDLPASAITEAVVDERLEPLGLDAGLLANTRDLFQLCNQARYAPSQQPGELVALLPKVEATLQQLQTLSTDAK